MKLSAPIFHLKRHAKRLARDEGIDLHVALERIATGEGFGSWSLLAARYAASSPAARLYAGLRSGDMLLIGARPGRGKTLLALEIAAEAVSHGRSGLFFTFEYTEAEVRERLSTLGIEPSRAGPSLAIDCSDGICADYIIAKSPSAGPGSVVVIDYLQLLDQKREHPPLAEQVAALKAFAEEGRLAIVLLSQIDRSYDPALKPVPDIADVRLPNAVDLALFTRTHFLGSRAADAASAR